MEFRGVTQSLDFQDVNSVMSNKLLKAVVTLLKSQPLSVRRKRRRQRRNRGNQPNGSLVRSITNPLSVRPQGFGPGRTTVNCTKMLDPSDFSNLVSFKLGDVLAATQEWQTYSPRYEIYKYVTFGVTVFPSAINSSGTSQLYILNRWAETSLIDSTSVKVADGVKIVPANIVRPKTFTFIIENYESNQFNMQSWHDVNNNGAQSWIYFFSGSVACQWQVQFDIRVVFAQPCPLTMPTKLTYYTFEGEKRIKHEEEK